MRRGVLTFGAAVLAAAWTGTAAAAVLCQRRSGTVVVRSACRTRETPIDLAQFGATGPQGAPGQQGPPGVGPLTECPPDSAQVGPVCVDKYEASVWQMDPANVPLVAKVKAGTVTLAELAAGGATQLGCGYPLSNQSPYPANFPSSGQWTPVPGSSPPSPGVYAVSVAGVLPAECTSWFQAAQACRLSGKRLLANLEWQDAVAGTPDPGLADDGSTTCATNTYSNNTTGARANCKSSWGVFDMVGNAQEWVADWADQASNCTDWTSQTLFAGADSLCFGGPGGTPQSSQGIPGALIRGGSRYDGLAAGVFSVTSHTLPPYGGYGDGFRCAR